MEGGKWKRALRPCRGGVTPTTLSTAMPTTISTVDGSPG
jgi:hypothetical protein